MDGSRDGWLIAAELLRPQGRRGELLAEPHVDPAFFSPGRKLWPSRKTPAPDTGAALEVEQAWQPVGRNAGRIVLKLLGIHSISDAETLAGQSLFVPVADLPALDPDTFRVLDLVGCTLLDGDRPVGTVVDIQFPVAADGRTRLTDAPDFLAVAPLNNAPGPEPDPVLVPFVRAWLAAVDLPARRIAMNLPPGLLDASEEPSS